MAKINLTLLDEVPRVAQGAIGKYHATLLDFLDSGKPAAQITTANHAEVTRLVGGFYRAITKYNLPVVVVKLGNVVYLIH